MQPSIVSFSGLSNLHYLWMFTIFGMFMVVTITDVNCLSAPSIQNTTESSAESASSEQYERPDIVQTTEPGCQPKTQCNQDKDCGTDGRWICKHGLCLSQPDRCRSGNHSCGCNPSVSPVGPRHCEVYSTCVENRCWQIKCQTDCDCTISDSFYHGYDVICISQFQLFPDEKVCSECVATCIHDGDCPPHMICHFYGLRKGCSYCAPP